MKEELKYIAWIVVAVSIATAVLRVTDFLAPDAGISDSVVIPADSGFVPIVQREYKPPSTPFERPQRPNVRLPRGVSEKDIRRTVIITKSQRVRTSGELLASDTTRLIELKSGKVLVQAEDGVDINVQETMFVPPILGWSLFVSGGVSIGRDEERFVLSPVLGFAPLEISGVLQLPLITADLYGIAAGFGVRQSNLVIGLSSHWRFDDAKRGVKLSIHYSI